MRANERRMRLIEELCERKFDTIDNLAFELGVSRRTICYDIEELSLSYPIFTAKGTGGGVWVRDGYRLGRRYLTEKQRELLERLSAGLTATRISDRSKLYPMMLNVTKSSPSKKSNSAR